MDRKGALAEYGRILKDAADWLAEGYRGNGEDDPILADPRESADRTESPGLGTRIGPGRAEGRSSDSFTEPSGQVAAEGAVRGGPESNPPKDGSPLAAGDPRAASPAHAESASAPAPPGSSAPPANQAHPAGAGGAVPRSGELEAVAAAVSECRGCNLYLIRENTVPGTGTAGSTLMVVTPPPAEGAGESDGPLPAFEAEYLGKWLSALGLDPGRDVFVTPAVKCRTPGGRPPHAVESAACAGHLRAQYKAVRPKAVLALGDAACGALTGSAADFPSLVAQDWTWGAVPALVLWTPAEVLANPTRLRKPVWDSLQRLKAAWNAAGTGV